MELMLNNARLIEKHCKIHNCTNSVVICIDIDLYHISIPLFCSLKISTNGRQRKTDMHLNTTFLLHIFFSFAFSSCHGGYAYIFFICIDFACVTVFYLPALGQPHSVFGVCACLARVCLLLALANSLPQRESGS